MPTPPAFNETAQVEELTAVEIPQLTLEEKIDYLYTMARRLEGIVNSITPDKIEKAKSLASGPFGSIFSKMAGL